MKNKIEYTPYELFMIRILEIKIRMCKHAGERRALRTEQELILATAKERMLDTKVRWGDQLMSQTA